MKKRKKKYIKREKWLNLVFELKKIKEVNIREFLKNKIKVKIVEKKFNKFY